MLHAVLGAVPHQAAEINNCCCFAGVPPSSPLQAHNVAALRAFLRDNQRDYAQAGKLPETERDRIEQEVGAYVRSCSANIDTLQQMLSTSGGSAAGSGTQPNANQLAHRQGQVLILSERLRSATALFDRLRSLRYQQLAAAEAARLRRMPQREPAAPSPPQTSAQHHEAVLRQRTAAAAAGERQAAGGPAVAPPAAAQQQIQAENAALQQELMGMNDQASAGDGGPLLAGWRVLGKAAGAACLHRHTCLVPHCAPALVTCRPSQWKHVQCMAECLEVGSPTCHPFPFTKRPSLWRRPAPSAGCRCSTQSAPCAR